MHSVRSISVIIALGSTLLGSNAQVTTSCNPLEGVCANDKGLASRSYSIDFTSVKSLPSEWVVADNEKVNLGTDGAELSFTKRYDAPTMRTDFNIFFGRVEYVVKAAPGTGIVSSMVMLSDDLDEIDWEFRGSITDSVQTNYFGKGYTGTYNRSTTESVSSPQATFHTYAVDWSPTALVWSIDGKTMRTLNAADADGNGSRYPQTPMKISLSLWDGGDPDTNSGTVEWAGGLTPLPPTQPWTMYVKSVNIWNSNPGKLYHYSDKTGSSKSIKVLNDTMTPSSSFAVQSTHTLSLAPAMPIPTNATRLPWSNTTYTGPRWSNTTSTRLPLLNTTSSCSTTRFVSHQSNGTAMPTPSPTLLVTSLSHSTLSPGSSTSNSTKPFSTTSSSLSLTAAQSMTPTANSAAAPTTSTPAAGTTSSLGVQTSYQVSQPSAVPSNDSLNPPTSYTSSSSSLEAAPQTYTQSPSASASTNSILPQAATSSVSATCTCAPPAAPTVSSSTPVYTTTSPSVTPAPSPAVTPVGGSPSGVYTGTANSPADSDSNTNPSPSATDSPFTNTDDGDTITNIPDTATDATNDDTTTTTSTTRTTSVTQFVTSTGTGTGTGTGASTNATSPPYPYTNGSYVPARGSLASTGYAPASASIGYPSASGSISGHSKATSSPLPYSLSDGSRVRVGWSMAVVAGTVAGFWGLLL